MNDQIVNDYRNLITGKDGQLFVTNRAGVNVFLMEVDSFTASLTANTVDYQAVGSPIQQAVQTGYQISLTFNEAVVRDDVLLNELIDDLQNGWLPDNWGFQGKYHRRDGQEQRIIYRQCVLSGQVDLQHLTPGEIVRRPWNFRVNAAPELMSQFRV
jgi:hypothetical protein